MEVTRENFKEILEEFKEVVEKASFFSIDGEFTGLSNESVLPYDTLSEYYKKMFDNDYIIIQLGISAFRISEDDPTKFKYRSYNFYICPQSRKQQFTCQGESVAFLADNNFDFNKLFRSGISYCDIIEATTLKNNLKDRQQKIIDYENEKESAQNEVEIPDGEKDNINRISNIVDAFLLSSNEKEKVIENCNAFQRKLIYQLLETKFAGLVYASSRVMPNNRKVIVVERHKTPEEERILLDIKFKKENDEISEFIGFTNIVKILSESGKLIIGHNMLCDISYFMRQFIGPLPAGLKEFKQITHQKFPNFLDTKYICSTEKFKDFINSSVLLHLYDHVSKQPFNLPNIEADADKYSYSLDKPKIHEAGYDAFLTGVCFLALTDFINIEPKNVNAKCPQLRTYLNKIFIMRLADISYIYLTGKEPEPSRDHIFYITFPTAWKQSDIVQRFKNYGFIYISWINSTSAFVSLNQREHAPIVLKTIAKSDEFTIISFANYQLSKNLTDTNLDEDDGTNKPQKRKCDSEQTL